MAPLKKGPLQGSNFARIDAMKIVKAVTRAAANAGGGGGGAAAAPPAPTERIGQTKFVHIPAWGGAAIPEANGKTKFPMLPFISKKNVAEYTEDDGKRSTMSHSTNGFSRPYLLR